jgi:hypothetical protein
MVPGETPRGALVRHAPRIANSPLDRANQAADDRAGSCGPLVVGPQAIPQVELDAFGRQLHAPCVREVWQHGL